MKLIEKAQKFAHAAHDSINQKRKYSGEPYWVHTDEVAYILISETDEPPEVIAAAHLHDILEDVTPLNSDYSEKLLSEEFGFITLSLVKELTDVFTHQNYPQYNRTKRKNLERERIAGISSTALTIKLADLISNTESIITHDPGFARIYLEEIDKIFAYLQNGNEHLFFKLKRMMISAKKLL